MNKIFTLITAFFTLLASAQVCTPDNSNTEGIRPPSANIACAIRQLPFSQTFTISFPTTYGGGTFQIQTVKIDSITNLPEGLTVSYQNNPPVYNGGDKMCFLVSGTPTDICGQYKIKIYTTVQTQLFPYSSEIHSMFASFETPYIRVISPGNSCPAVDENQSQDFSAYNNCTLPEPILTCTAASNITSVTAQFNGTVNAQNHNCTIYFEWGGNTNYGAVRDADPITVTGSTLTAVSSVVYGLSPQTTYHYRLRAEYTYGPVYSSDYSFTTAAATTQPTGTINWATPVGGNITNNNLYGYNNVSGIASSNQTSNSETWSTLDIDGDGKPDLVVTGALSNNNNTQFNANSSPYWKVYLNTGTRFSSTVTNWTTPMGGNITNNTLNGYNSTAGVAASNQSTNSETWSTFDINGDGKPDLVVMGALSNNNNTQFNPSTAPFWKVYLNTGTGFSTTATNWATPVGGNITNNSLYGYNNASGLATPNLSTNSETWGTFDINGDGKPDLVITGALSGISNRQFNATSLPYWKVYLNTGSGFSSTATNWSTPVGGNIANNNLYGYNNFSGVAVSNQSNNSETWNTLDINGDGKPDLVVMGALSNFNNVQFNATTSPYWKVFLNTGSGFSSTANNWSTPEGGNITSNDLIGYNNLSGLPTNGQSDNSETWNTFDINGDSKPDLVVSSTLTNGGIVQFGATSSPYWKVYLNTGSGFSNTATNWSTPTGGNITNNDLYGYNNVSGIGIGALGQTNNSETWSTIDIDGDKKPDLVITGALNNNNNIGFDASGSPYWKVYKNQISTGIADVNAAITYMLYPNPSSDKVTLAFDTDDMKEVAITDIAGSIVQSTITVQQQQTFDVSTLPAGIYLLHITQSNASQTVKLIIQK